MDLVQQLQWAQCELTLKHTAGPVLLPGPRRLRMGPKPAMSSSSSRPSTGAGRYRSLPNSHSPTGLPDRCSLSSSARQTGEASIRGNDATAKSKKLLSVGDKRGNAVGEALPAAAQSGGSVECQDGAPKTAYAVDCTSGISASNFVLLGGCPQGVSHLPALAADQPRLAVAASGVMDAQHSSPFFRRGGRSLPRGCHVRRPQRPHQSQQRLTCWETGIRGPFARGSGEDITQCHGSQPYCERKPTEMEGTYSTGTGTRSLRGANRRSAARRQEYPPAIEGDEETGSPKFGCAVSFPVPDTDQRTVIGSGKHLDTNSSVPCSASLSPQSSLDMT